MLDVGGSSASITDHALLTFSLHAHVPIFRIPAFSSLLLHSLAPMTARHAKADEETPLLCSQTHKTQTTPLPWGQFTILLLHLAEPLTSHLIYPFAPEVTVISLPSHTQLLIFGSPANPEHWRRSWRRNQSRVLRWYHGS